jgi:deoxycytidylate deaminase
LAKSENERPDLYIGLVCAAGTDLTDLKSQLSAQLNVVGYDTEEIKVSALISELLEIPKQDDEYSRIKTLMAAGDSIRINSEDGNGVGAAIVAEIRRRRAGSDTPSSKAYVIDSLKNPAEIALLDLIYGRNFYTISVFLPKRNRIETLTKLIAQDRHTPPTEEHTALAKELIKDDERGAGKRCQNVEETFPKADFFVDGTRDVSTQMKRFVELVFREPFTTPTPDEFYMFVAKAAALRSCDLSRLVGAAIVHDRFGIVATGANEVPYPGGGIFYEGRSDGIGDNRDKEEGHDPNYLEIHRTLIELMGILIETNHVSTNRTADDVADELLHGDHKEILKNARIRNLIEFGRVVHAEMHAITQAAAAGRSVAGCTLYCTTFPCHGCARHIISAGISEVVFIEPYPKSLTRKLYGKEIEMGNAPLSPEERANLSQVRFRPFHGVAPALYQRVFAMRDRKDDRGVIAKWAPKKAIPVGAVFGVERSKVETAASNSVAEILEKVNLPQENQKGEIRNGTADASRTDQ